LQPGDDAHVFIESASGDAMWNLVQFLYSSRHDLNAAEAHDMLALCSRLGVEISVTANIIDADEESAASSEDEEGGGMAKRTRFNSAKKNASNRAKESASAKSKTAKKGGASSCAGKKTVPNSAKMNVSVECNAGGVAAKGSAFKDKVGSTVTKRARSDSAKSKASSSMAGKKAKLDSAKMDVSVEGNLTKRTRSNSVGKSATDQSCSTMESTFAKSKASVAGKDKLDLAKMNVSVECNNAKNKTDSCGSVEENSELDSVGISETAEGGGAGNTASTAKGSVVKTAKSNAANAKMSLTEDWDSTSSSSSSSSQKRRNIASSAADHPPPEKKMKKEEGEIAEAAEKVMRFSGPRFEAMLMDLEVFPRVTASGS
jgi:hypothetical protein